MFTGSTTAPVSHISEYYKIRYHSRNSYSLVRHSDTLAGPDRIEHTRDMGYHKTAMDAIAKCTDGIAIYLMSGDYQNHRIA